MNILACAFTGHRPVRFSFGYDESDERCVKLKALMTECIAAHIAEGVNTFYSGMALGVDIWAAEIVADIKKARSDIRLIAVIPCKTQADCWSAEQRERYNNILARCDDAVTLNEHYTRSCMFERNRYLVNNAEYLIAVFDGRAKGGTAYTVKYAKQKQRRITVIDPDSLEVTTAETN